MNIVTLPSDLPVKRQDFGLQAYDLTFSNSESGAMQVAVLGPARRTCTLVSEERIPLMRDAAAWRSLVHSMRGQVNLLAVHDMLQPVPRGTARGAWTAVATAAGASELTIRMGASEAGKTLLQGDWIGVNQGSNQRQMLHVQADAVADAAGVITVRFEPVLRTPVVAGSAVVWDRPTCLMRRVDSKTTWASESRTQGGFSLDLMESWEQ